MARICSWNVRGLNWPNKQEDIKLFLHEKNIFHGWQWHHNFNLNTKGRIWVAWKPSLYKVQILSTEEQFIHCQVTMLHDMRKFFITFIYGANQEGQRQVLWDALEEFAAAIDEGWCILGDFNAVLNTADRMGGTEITAAEIRPLNDCINTCEVQELRSIGPYYTWTNKSIWTRIDRAFVNALWYDLFDFCQVIYMANSLSDHTALIIDSPKCPKPPPTFHFCDMWTRDADFIHLVEAHITAAYQKKDPFICLFWYLHRTRKELQKLNKHQYADLKSQLSKARNDLEKIQAHLFEDPMNKQLAQRENTQRNHYTLILSSVIDILRQQCKAEWLAYGDECTRYFFARAKQRKTSSCHTYLNCMMTKASSTRVFQQWPLYYSTTIRVS